MRRFAPLLAALLFAAAAPLAAAERRPALHLEVEGHGENGLSVTVEGAWVAGLMGALAVAGLDCDTTTDPDLRALLRHLEREGEGGRAELREDGDRVYARRHRGHLELVVVDDDGERAEVVVPWPLARCLLGGHVSLHEALDAARRGELEVSVRGRDGTLRVTLD